MRRDRERNTYIAIPATVAKPISGYIVEKEAGKLTYYFSCTSRFQMSSPHSSQMFAEPYQLCLYLSALHT